MHSAPHLESPNQSIFRQMVVGILIYSVVLGFFNDYTEILSTTSYSITFFMAIVMQILTYLTFQLKGAVINHFKDKEGSKYKAAMVFIVWLIMFLSKFVFLEVIDVIFGTSVEISGFIGLVLIIVTMVAADKLIDVVYGKL